MKKFLFIYLSLFLVSVVSSQEEFLSKELKVNEFVEGTLLAPPTEKVPLAIFIAGSGPTDRNGNQAAMNNNSLKKLATALAKKNIASFRYDKRILKAGELNIREQDMRFDDFIIDAKSVIKFFKPAEQFSEIYIIGHSQGSLVGMLAAKNNTDGFVSIAGAGQSIDSVITEQISRQMPQLKESTQQAFATLREDGKVTDYNPMLASIFRESVQPFIHSWLKYDPQQAIKELSIPVLIINGDNDLQVNEGEAEKLKAAQPEAELVIIEGMNHVFRIIEKDDNLDNQKSYNEPSRPISSQLIEEIVAFIQQKK